MKMGGCPGSVGSTESTEKVLRASREQWGELGAYWEALGGYWEGIWGSLDSTGAYWKAQGNTGRQWQSIGLLQKATGSSRGYWNGAWGSPDGSEGLQAASHQAVGLAGKGRGVAGRRVGTGERHFCTSRQELEAQGSARPGARDRNWNRCHFPVREEKPDPAAGGSSHCRSENRAGGLGGGGGGGTLSWFLFICLVMKCFEGKCQLRRCCCQVLFGARGGGTRAGGVGGGTARECACFWPRGSSTVRGSPPASLPSTSGGIRRDFSWARLAGQRPFLPQVQARGR